MPRRKHCHHCAGVHSGYKSKCPVCGRKLIHRIPTLEEIYSEAEAIRADWASVRLQKCELYQELEIHTASRCGDGMRRRDKEDGRET